MRFGFNHFAHPWIIGLNSFNFYGFFSFWRVICCLVPRCSCHDAVMNIFALTRQFFFIARIDSSTHTHIDYVMETFSMSQCSGSIVGQSVCWEQSMDHVGAHVWVKCNIYTRNGKLTRINTPPQYSIYSRSWLTQYHKTKTVKKNCWDKKFTMFRSTVAKMRMQRRLQPKQSMRRKKNIALLSWK